MSICVVGAARVITRFKAMGPDARSRLVESVGRSVLRLKVKIVTQKLSGQVLKRRSGTLARSVEEKVLEQGAEVLGIVSTNTEYAAKHEYGFKGPESVKAHLRTMKQAWGRPLAEPREVQVGAFTRNVNFPERSFMRSALDDMREGIVGDMVKSVGEALK